MTSRAGNDQAADWSHKDTHTHRHTHTQGHTHTKRHTQSRTRTQRHTQICTHRHIQKQTHTDTDIDTHRHAHTHTHTQGHTHRDTQAATKLTPPPRPWSRLRVSTGRKGSSGGAQPHPRGPLGGPAVASPSLLFRSCAASPPSSSEAVLHPLPLPH